MVKEHKPIQVAKNMQGPGLTITGKDLVHLLIKMVRNILDIGKKE